MKKFLIPIAAIIIVASGTIAGLELTDTTHMLHKQSPTTATTIKLSGNNQSSNSTKQTPPPVNPTNNPSLQTPKQFESPNSSQPPTSQITGVVNYKAVQGNNLVIRVTINQLLSSGTCQLILSSQSTGVTTTSTAPVASAPQSSTCQGFSVPTSQLSSGQWNILVKVTSGSMSGTITSNIQI